MSGISTTFVSGMEVFFRVVGLENGTTGSQTALKLTINFTEATQFGLNNSNAVSIFGGSNNISTGSGGSGNVLDPSAMVTHIKRVLILIYW